MRSESGIPPVYGATTRIGFTAKFNLQKGEQAQLEGERSLWSHL
jgi:hypothetical protein